MVPRVGDGDPSFPVHPTVIDVLNPLFDTIVYL